jgi:hypothetical protein
VEMVIQHQTGHGRGGPLQPFAPTPESCTILALIKL